MRLWRTLRGMSNCSSSANERKRNKKEAIDCTTRDGSSIHDDHLVSTWLQEQEEISARVRVDLDPSHPPHGHRRVGRRFTLVPNRSLIPHEFHLFGGVDVSFAASESHQVEPDARGDGVANELHLLNNQSSSSVSAPPLAVAVYVVWDSRTGSVAYQDHETFPLRVPYVPSFLAFREIDPLVRLVDGQRRQQPHLTPHAILVDGNGILHPRRAGIACFLGVRTGLPTIGVGKSMYNMGGLTKAAVMKALDDAKESAAYALQTDLRETNATISSSSNVLFDSRPVRGRQHSPALPDDVHATIDAMDEPRSGQAGDRMNELSTLAAHCQGLAVPLGCLDPSSNASIHAALSFLDPNPLPCHRVLACAMVGHGGRNGKIKVAAEEAARNVGSAKPVFVSVGHRISLSSAVAICAFLSLSRIPEPIRQADLIGRELIRQQQRKGSTSCSPAT
jgi:deoxyinosine 3'endonuclease (endonuclease V)